MAPRAPVAETGDDLSSRNAGFAPLAGRQEGIVMTDEKKTGSTDADEAVVVVAATVADDRGVIAQGAIAAQGDHALVVAQFADDRAARGRLRGPPGGRDRRLAPHRRSSSWSTPIGTVGSMSTR
jgi:hypothetical protein